MNSLRLSILILLFSAGAQGATISGTVTNDTASPLGAMTVAAYTTTGTLAATGGTTSSGTYSLTVPAGTYHLLAYDASGTFATSFYADAESFETSASIAVTSSESLTNINFRLVRSGFVVGRISSNTNASLPGMTVAAYNLSGTRRGFTTTDSTGAFTLALPPGTYKIAAFDETLGYTTMFFDAATSFAAATSVTVISTQSSAVNIQLQPAARLRGTVTDRTTSTALGGMRVTAYTQAGGITAQSLTGSDGRYAIAVSPGTIRLVVDDPSGNYATTYVPDAESFSTATAMIALAGQTLTIDATMVRGAHLTGRVTDRATGSPLANINAVAYNADGTTRAFAISDATGAYSIVVPPGDFRIGVFDTALVFVRQFYPNQTTFDAATPQHAIAQQSVSGLDFALTKGARVTAHVTSRTSSAPLSGVTFAAYDLGGNVLARAITDSSGTAVLFLAPGSVKLLAFDESLQFAPTYYLDAPSFEATQALALVEGQALSATFAMPDAGRIRGTVVDATTGAPIAGIQLIAYDSAFQRTAEATTGAQGAFVIAVRAGTYTLGAIDRSHRYADLFVGGMPIIISAGQDVTSVRLALSPASKAARRRSVRH